MGSESILSWVRSAKRKPSILGLTYGDAASLYKSRMDELLHSFDGNVVYEFAHFADGVGGSTSDSGSSISAGVSVPFVADNDGTVLSSMIKRPISDSEYVQHLVALEHETQHVRQMLDARNVDGNAGMALILANDDVNRIHYRIPGNYFRNSTEIDAERAGFLNAREDLSREFPDVSGKELDGLMFDYLKSRTDPVKMQDGSFMKPLYFVDVPHDWTRDSFTMEKAKSLFDAAAQTAAQCPSDYGRGIRFDRTPDDFTQTVYVADIRSPWWTAYDRLKTTETEFESHVVIGSITCLNHPDLLDKYPALRQIETKLSPDHVFGNGFLSRVSEYDRQRGATPLYLSYQDKGEAKAVCREYPHCEIRRDIDGQVSHQADFY